MAQIAQQDNLIIEITGALDDMNELQNKSLLIASRWEQLPMFFGIDRSCKQC